MRVAELALQRLQAIADAAGLVDRTLLGNGQMQGQVQERVGSAGTDRVVGGQRFIDVFQVGMVLGMPADQVAGLRLDRRHRQLFPVLAPGLAEEAADIGGSGVEDHRDSPPGVSAGWPPSSTERAGGGNDLGV